jgi:hypothetical protein
MYVFSPPLQRTGLCANAYQKNRGSNMPGLVVAKSEIKDCVEKYRQHHQLLFN